MLDQPVVNEPNPFLFIALDITLTIDGNSLEKQDGTLPWQIENSDITESDNSFNRFIYHLDTPSDNRTSSSLKGSR